MVSSVFLFVSLYVVGNFEIVYCHSSRHYHYRNQLYHHEFDEGSSVGYFSSKQRRTLSSFRGGDGTNNINDNNTNVAAAADNTIVGAANGGGGGGGDDLNDEDLDKYIEFLLAYADNQVTETDNPLFRDDDDKIYESIETKEEEDAEENSNDDIKITAVKDDTDIISSIKDSIEQIKSLPLNNDGGSLLIMNEKQLDVMVETLVASIDDEESEEQEEEREMKVEVEVNEIPKNTTDALIPTILPAEAIKKAYIQDSEEEEGGDANFGIGIAIGEEQKESIGASPIIFEEKIPASIKQHAELKMVDRIVALDDDVDSTDGITMKTAENSLGAFDNYDEELYSLKKINNEEVDDLAIVEDEIPIIVEDEIQKGSSSDSNDVENQRDDSSLYVKGFVDSTRKEWDKKYDDYDVTDEESLQLIKKPFHLGSSAVVNIPAHIEGKTSLHTVPIKLEADDTDTLTQHTLTSSTSNTTPITEETKRSSLFSSFLQSFRWKNSNYDVNTVTTKNTVAVEVSDDILDDEPTTYSVSSDSLGDLDVPVKKRINKNDTVAVEIESKVQKVDSHDSSISDQGVVRQIQEESSDFPPSLIRYIQCMRESFNDFWHATFKKDDVSSNSIPEGRDYTIIYEKYFASQHKINTIGDNNNNNNNFQQQQKHESRSKVFIKPWGAVAHYLKRKVPPESTTAEEKSKDIESGSYNSSSSTKSSVGHAKFEEIKEAQEVSEETEQFSLNDIGIEVIQSDYIDNDANTNSKITKEKRADSKTKTLDLYYLGIKGIQEDPPGIDINADNEVTKEQDTFVLKEIDVRVEISDNVEESIDDHTSATPYSTSFELSEDRHSQTEEIPLSVSIEENIRIEFNDDKELANVTDEEEVEEEEEEENVIADFEVNDELDKPKALAALIQKIKDEDKKYEKVSIEEEIIADVVDFIVDSFMDNDDMFNTTGNTESVSDKPEEESIEIQTELELDSGCNSDNKFDDFKEITDNGSTAIVNLEVLDTGDDSTFQDMKGEEEESESDCVTVLSKKTNIFEDHVDTAENRDTGIFDNQESWRHSVDVEDRHEPDVDFIKIDAGKTSETINEVSEEGYDNEKQVSMDSNEFRSITESTNFLWTYMLANGLEQWVMISLVISEWLEFYILDPLLASVVWIIERQRKIVLKRGFTSPKWLSTRGGAQIEEEIESTEENLKEQNSSEFDYKESTAVISKEQNDEIVSDDRGEDANESIGKTSSRLVSHELRKAPIRDRVPPNLIFRSLLDFGFVGHIMIMELILATEWLRLYTPMLLSFYYWIVHDILKIRKASRSESGANLYKRTSGLINLSDASRLGKKSRRQTKKEDQRALDNLRNIGDVNQAKYSFVTEAFMKRHSIGPFGNYMTTIETEVEANSNGSFTESSKSEGDSSWILEALAHESDENDIENSFSSPIETDVSLGSEGPKMTVGINFSVGKVPRRKSKNRTQLQSAARQFDYSDSFPRERTAGPRVSDIQSGVMGRLRAAGANSYMGRSILGAYPGDLPPPEEAADASGLVDFAQRYGYGEWSDYSDIDEDGMNDDFILNHLTKEGSHRRKKRSSNFRTTKKKGRERRIHQQKAGVNFDLDSRKTLQTQSSTLSDLFIEKRDNPYLGSSSSTKRSRPRSRLPSSAMAKIDNAEKSTSSSNLSRSNLENVQGTRTKMARSRTIKPAMSLLEEKARKID